MEPKNKFDEKLREKLNQHSERVPCHIWEKIAEQREQRKAGFWRLRRTWLLLLLLLGGGIYVMNETAKEHKAAPSETAAIEKRKEIFLSENTKPENERSKVIEVQSQRQISNTETQNRKDALKNALQKNAHDQSQDQTRQTENLNSTLKTIDARAIQENSKTASVNKRNNADTTAGNNNDETQPQASSVVPELNAAGLIKAADDSSSEIRANKETIERDKEAEPQISSQTPDSAAAGLLRGASIDSTAGAFEVKNSMELPVKGDSATAGQGNEAAKTMPYFQKHPVYLEIYISPEQATKDLQAKPSEPNSDYLNLRNESEAIDNAFSTGMNLRYQINNHYFIRAGIRYSVINETFYSKQAKQEAVPSLDSTIKGYFIDPYLHAVPIYGYNTTYTYRSVYVEQPTHNSYRFIDIPVSAGIQFRLKQLGFYVSAGIELNLLVAASGMIAGQSSPDLIDLSSAQTPFNKASLSFQSGFGCAYHFSPSFEIFLEPDFRKQLTSMTKTEYPLDQQYTRIGVMAGIKYNIP